MSVRINSLELVTDIRISDERWKKSLKDLELISDSALIHASAEMKTGGEVSVLFTHDEEMRQLNSRWRSLDKPTDVLSFPSDDREVPGRPRHLGDIALGFETALRDAEAMNRPFDAHVSHLVIHGFLHLVGYDHIEAEDAAVMEPLETKILGSLGWPDPYATGPYAGEKDKG